MRCGSTRRRTRVEQVKIFEAAIAVAAAKHNELALEHVRTVCTPRRWCSANDGRVGPRAPLHVEDVPEQGSDGAVVGGVSAQVVEDARSISTAEE